MDALRAIGALLVATVIWGMTFVIVQDALADLPVLHLLTYRFALAGLLLLPWCLRWRARTHRPFPWRSGLWLGAALFVAFLCQTAGLLWTTPSRSAFLTGLSVVFVPLFGRALGRSIAAPALIGGLLALAGLYALYQPGLGGEPFGLGDWLCLGCGAGFAVHMLMTERMVSADRVVPLAMIQFLGVAALSSPSLVASPPAATQFTSLAIWAIAITGILATAVGFACQLYAQVRLSAARTAVILTLEPIVAALYSIAIGREAWTGATLVGGAMILAGIVVSQAPGAARVGDGRLPRGAPGV